MSVRIIIAVFVLGIMWVIYANAVVSADLSVTELILVDADTNRDLMPVSADTVIDLTVLPTDRVNFRVNTAGTATLGSVRFELSGAKSEARTENGAPYAMFGDSSGDFYGKKLPPGNYQLSATPYTERSMRGEQGQNLTVAFAIIKSAGDIGVSGFTVIDSESETELLTLTPNAVLDLTAFGTEKLTLRAETSGNTPVGSVVMELAGELSKVRRDSSVPYSLYGDNTDGYYGTRFPLGSYVIAAMPYIDSYAEGAAGQGLAMPFSVIKSAGDIAISSLILLDGETDTDLLLLTSGAVLDLTHLAATKFNIRAVTGGATPMGSVVFELTGPKNKSKVENSAPYALFGDKDGDFYATSLPQGNYTLTATPHIDRNGGGAAGQTLELSFSVIKSAGDISISSLTLVDSNNNQDIMELQQNSVLDLTSLPTDKFTIRANTAGATPAASVYFELTGPKEKYRADNSPPFALYGDSSGDYYGSSLSQGNYTLKATPYIERNAEGSAGPGIELAFSVIKSAGDLTTSALVLINPESNSDVITLSQGSVIDLLQLPEEKLNFRADITGTTEVGSVLFELSGPIIRQHDENSAPYALFGDKSGDFYGKNLGVGSYVLKATPHIERNGGGAGGQPLEIAFNIVRGSVDGSSSLLNAGPSPHGISVADAARFLSQATFGPSKEAITELRQIGYSAWLNTQQQLPATLHKPYLDDYLAQSGSRSPAKGKRMEAWFYYAAEASDQLCQRMAFALSEIFVVSDRDPALSGSEQAFGMAHYYDILVRHCFGNFRSLMEEVTLSPVMGTFLTSVNNKKPDPLEGAMPDENYSRELKQLLTIGLCLLNQDGSRQTLPDVDCIATFDQPDIEAGARVLTGWTYAENEAYADYGRKGKKLIDSMLLDPEYHDYNSKQILGVTLPASQDGYTDLQVYLDVIFSHNNVAPFISRQLIQRLVTSNPSPDYIFRVASVFNDNGSGVRGDLGAVVSAILLDPEARDSSFAGLSDYGKVREPILLPMALWRGFDAGYLYGDSYRYNYPEESFGQAPLRAASVFSFFLPDYQHPGEIASLGLYSPELQIMTETRLIAIANELYEWIYYNRGREMYNIAEETGIVEANCLQLADHLSLLFMGGQITPALHAGVSSIACDTQIKAADRVRDGIYLLLTSPEFSVQR